MGSLAVSAPLVRYQAPRLVRKHEATPYDLSGWIIILVALALAIIWYGSLWAFCTATCGWGHVYSCEAQWNVWAKVVCKP